MTGQTHVLTAAPGPTQVRAAWKLAAVALAVAVLFVVYWRLSVLTPVTSDGAANALQAQAMLHGNLLLHNWWVSDVSFYTTELPQYMLIEAVLGLGPWVVHVAAAMTYTLLVVLAALIAKGHARGRAGLARALLAAGIMLAPQLSATQILLLQPEHAGTSVPVLLAWLVMDRGPGTRPRALVPAVVCVILAATAVGDSSALLTAIVPLVLVCLLRACPGVMRGPRTEPRWYELSLAGAGAVAALGFFAPRVIAALGGFRQWPVVSGTAPVGLWARGAKWTFQGILELFGANVFQASPAIEVVFAVVHLAGVVLVVGAVVLALVRFLRFQDLVIPVLAVGIVLNLVAYATSTRSHGILDTREIAGVLGLGAALAGRMFGERVLAVVLAAVRTKSWALLALAVVASGYLGALAYDVAQPSVPPANQPLASWLVAHGLTDGLAGYWQASSTTVDSGGRVLVSGVTMGGGGRLVPYEWETDDSEYNPSLHYANFVVAGGLLPLPDARSAALRTFGPPQRVYRYDGYLVMVWNTNLLTRLPLHVQDAPPGHHQQRGHGTGGDQAQVGPGKIPFRGGQQQDQRQQVGLDERAAVAERAAPDLAGQ
jgi:hypothetical protein